MPICCAAEAANSAMPQNAPPRSSIWPLIQNGTPGSALRALPRRSKTSTIKNAQASQLRAAKKGIRPHIAAAHTLRHKGCAPDQRPQQKQQGVAQLFFIKVHLLIPFCFSHIRKLPRRRSALTAAPGHASFWLFCIRGNQVVAANALNFHAAGNVEHTRVIADIGLVQPAGGQARDGIGAATPRRSGNTPWCPPHRKWLPYPPKVPTAPP